MWRDSMALGHLMRAACDNDSRSSHPGQMRELLLGMPVLEVFRKGNAGGQKTRKGKIVIHLIISAKHSVSGYTCIVSTFMNLK